MRQLTQREKKLAVILLGAIFLMLNLFVVLFLIGRQGALEKKLTAQRADQRDAKSWLAQKDLWLQREKWMNEKQPKLQTVGQANAALLESLQTSARAQSLNILDQSFVEVKPDTKAQLPYQEISVRLNVGGSLESVARWLADIQQPGKFQAVPAISMKSDTDPAKILCELTVSRYYAPSR
jgi:hypothetical protein